MSRTDLPSLKFRSDEDLAEIEAEEKRRQAAVHYKKLAFDLGARYTPDRATIAGYEVYEGTQKKAVKALGDFLHNLVGNVALGRCIVLYGTVGTGKDHLLAASLYAAAKAGFSCRWVGGQDLYAGIRDTMDKRGATEAEFLEKWTEPEILGLSDPMPPVGDLNVWRKELLYRLVDRRYRFMRPTWVTLNAADEKDVDNKLGQQVWDRLQENGLVIACKWPSYRERKK